MALHLLSTPDSDKVQQLLALLQAQDCLVLVGDGVYAQKRLMESLPASVACWVRSADLTQRGLSLVSPAQALSDEQWVALSLEHAPIISWHD